MVHDPAFKVYEQHLKSIHVSQDLPRSFHPAESSHTLHELQSHWLPITLSFLESLDSSQSVPFLSLKEPDSKWSTIIHEGVAILREQQTLASNVALLRDDIGLGERAIRTDTRPAVYRIHRDKEWGSLFKKLLYTASKLVVLQHKHKPRSSSMTLSEEHSTILIGAGILCRDSRLTWDHGTLALTAWDRCKLVMLAQNFMKRVSPESELAQISYLV